MVVHVERDEVERPFVAQLEAMGWTHIPGAELGTLDAAKPLLVDQLGPALRRINVRGSDGQPWMGDDDIQRVVNELASLSLGNGVVQANLAATDMLLHGWTLPSPSAAHGGPSATVQYVEWHPDLVTRNTFTVVDQLRVRSRSGELSILDLVLFVNGIPIVAVECKSADLAEPVRSAVLDLRYYAGNPVLDLDATGAPLPAGVPELFRTVQLLVAATGETAHLGTVTSEPEHFHPWRSVEPEDGATLRRELRTAGLLADDTEAPAPLGEQQKLVGVVLRPAALLNVVRHYVIPMAVESGADGGAVRTVKAVARHQQYRATEKAVRRLLTGRPRAGWDTDDERGGVIWHTQGSGKSLTMTFLVRRVHLHHRLSEFMVVVVTDRTQLQTQLSRTLKLSESDVETAKTRTQMEGLLRDGGRRVVFGMIQKYGTGFTFAGDAEGSGDDRDLVGEGEQGEQAETQGPVPDFPECNTSRDILVLVDEAHRSHTSVLHAALRKAIPNAAKIGFTGTPIITGREEDTRRIFGRGDSPRGFLDEYRMEDAEHDGVVVRIRYEGRTGEGEVRDGEVLDAGFDDLVRDRTPEERAALLKRWPTERDVAESVPMIEAKAEDMLEHWVTTVLPGGFKAQVAAVSRKAAVQYHHALRKARDELLAELAEFDPGSVVGTPLENLSRRLRYLHQAHQFRALLRRIDFVPVISPGSGHKRGEWREWTDSGRQEAYTERFQKVFPELAPDPEWVAVTPFNPAQTPCEPIDPADGMNAPWSAAVDGEPSPLPTSVPDPVHPDSPIAFLIVKSMLLTGFDAPREQVLYLDRPIRDAELLQAVARVNRTSPGKEVGYVVDYYGVFEHLSSALAGYRNADVTDTMRSLSDEVGNLGPAADRVREFLRRNGIDDAELDQLAKLGPAALALQPEALRFDFDEVLHAFLATLERVLPHEDALDYIADARRWSLLQKRVRRLCRDAEGGTFTLRRYGRKVRAMIADHLEGPEIDQVIPPVSLTALTFDDAVRRLPPQEAAAEMGHALRFHLEERTKREDPAKYARLSERLEEILRTMPGRFEEQIEEFGPLIEEARQEQEEAPELAGLTPLEQKVYRLVEQILEGTPGIKLADGGDIRELTGRVCDVATRVMARASYQGQHQDISMLAGDLHEVLLSNGVRPVDADWSQVDNAAERLASFAQDNLRQFRGRARGE
ncbi:type I restriction endonuclease subunit R [Streptomyces griseorubiginosus]|uniref:type I site-specific deoxyribonuclease n=1 Tax=Streptomyces griseorubiginosus TaxID=67304 RepID=A0AAI8L4B7_9ACTN|nr:type I restriction endonuclease [Streptomyces griseorubiginosus]AYC41066.1 Type-1 restriction enzyme R protein [Streptomyces griseorubiginosus]